MPSILVYEDFLFWGRRGWSAGVLRRSRFQGAELLLVGGVLVWLRATLKYDGGGLRDMLDVGLVESDG